MNEKATKLFFMWTGIVFRVLAWLGAVIPNMHFHVIFAGDDEAAKFHKARLVEVEANLNAKEQKK